MIEVKDERPECWTATEGVTGNLIHTDDRRATWHLVGFDLYYCDECRNYLLRRPYKHRSADEFEPIIQ